ncbi:unnamed protein product [Arctogadus glacialis]
MVSITDLELEAPIPGTGLGPGSGAPPSSPNPHPDPEAQSTERPDGVRLLSPAPGLEAGGLEGKALHVWSSNRLHIRACISA